MSLSNNSVWCAYLFNVIWIVFTVILWYSLCDIWSYCCNTLIHISQTQPWSTQKKQRHIECNLILHIALQLYWITSTIHSTTMHLADIDFKWPWHDRLLTSWKTWMKYYISCIVVIVHHCYMILNKKTIQKSIWLDSGHFERS